MTDQRGNDWRTILVVLGAAGGAVLAFSTAALVLAAAAMRAVQPASAPGAAKPLLDVVMTATALVVIGAVFLPTVYYGIRRFSGHPVPAVQPGTLKIRQGVLLVVAWLLCAVGAGLLFDKPIAKWLTPLLYALAIIIPVVFFVRLSTGGLNTGSPARSWGTLAAGIELGIAPSMIAEVAVVFLLVIGVGVYIGLHPDQLAAFRDLARRLENAPDLQEITDMLGPWVRSPLALLGALVFFAGVSPFIEEIAKSLATWAVFDRLSSAAQGFAIGAISGAAFGLVESLLVSATPESQWTTTLLVRGASTMMHIMSAALTGWGIGQFRTKRNLGMLIGMYALAMTLHGLWNGSVVAIAFGGIRSAAAPGKLDPLAILLILLGGAILVVLVLSIPLAMAFINLHFRRAEGPAITAPRSAAAAPVPSDVRWALNEEHAPRPPEDTPPAGE